ncbi:MAG: hypothetical protein CSA20_07230, partial [Deltaproteobacteria bacterium]
MILFRILFLAVVSVICGFSPLYSAGLDFGSLKATPVSVLSITPTDTSKLPLPPGESLQLVANTFPEGMAVRWEVASYPAQNGEQARASISSGGVLHADRQTGDGWVKVTASVEGGGSKTVGVQIGCPSCSGGSCDYSAGNGFVQLGSIDFRISLGQAEDGLPAGDLFLYGEEATSDLASPKALQVSTLSENVALLYDDEMLRQVIAPQVIVSIVADDENSYEIDVYERGAGGGFEDGLFVPDERTSPVSRWLVEGVVADERLQELRITRERRNTETLYLYSYEEDTGVWSLSSGNGERQESRREFTDAAGDRVVLSRIRGADGKEALVRESTYRRFAWGEELIGDIVDPSGARLVTSLSYYTAPGPGYGRLRQRIEADGSWQRFVYDAEGRLLKSIQPWLDSKPEEPESHHRVTVYDYSLLAGDSNRQEDAFAPRTITEYSGGIVSGKSFYVFGEEDGGRLEIIEKCGVQDCRYGDAGSSRTVRRYYPPAPGSHRAGRLRSIHYADGRMVSYSYQSGRFIPSADPDYADFRPGEDKALRTIMLQSSAAHPEGIPHRSTRVISIDDWLGHRVMSETEVRVKDGWERIDWSYSSYDGLGRMVERLYGNGTRIQERWSCCHKLSETDRYGLTTSYRYDSLQRRIEEKDEATGRLTSFSYDALGHRTGRRVSNGDLFADSSWSYDQAGRLQSSTDESGLTTSYRYAANLTHQILPGGGEVRTEYYLDGRLKSVSGSAVVARYYSYGITASGIGWSRVAIGSPDSPRTETTSRDLLGRIVAVDKPGPSGRIREATFYDARGRMVRQSRTGQSDRLFVYDELGELRYFGLDLDGNGQLLEASVDRVEGSAKRYLKADNAWWLEERREVFATADSAVSTTLSRRRTRLTGWQGRTISESIEADVSGNTTTVREELDRS